ncbi:MAG: acyl-CoA synthetase FdrA [Candidatus Atribacteria bacterium]|nr:MAG: acyl-CoA synthetase FdrA [Candidatus Atribacteria bacterium]
MKELIVERNRYFDSVFLMRISSELEKLSGVTQAVVAMATPINVENLMKSGFELRIQDEAIRPADLIIAIDAESSEAAACVHDQLAKLLAGGTGDEASPSAGASPTSLDAALAADPDINLALISVPGIHATREARKALHRGLHVMLFSDNVTVKDEIALKDDAINRGLLMMGPDCGTAILNGAALGFANACRSGSIGIVGASGTGIQEISSLVHQLGGGISQAIGTGGRDLSADVDGRMTRFGIEALGCNPDTNVIVVVSKTPSPTVADKVLASLAATGKPGVVHFIGGQAAQLSDKLETTGTLADAALAAVVKSGNGVPEVSHPAGHPSPIPTPTATSSTGVSADSETPKQLATITGRVAGFYCGGTLCQEAWNILTQAGIDVSSNVAGDKRKKIHPETEVAGHVVWDLGDDAFTVGKPHPMIEPSLRDSRVAQAGADPTVGVILADCVIGYGAHENPAASLAEAALRAIDAARKDGRRLIVVASVTGTDQDPQNLHHQRKILEVAGITVAPSNAAAARWVVHGMKGGIS